MLLMLGWLPVVQAKASDTSVTQTQSYFVPQSDLRREIISSINQAQISLDLVIYSITDEDVSQALIQASHRGVTVRVMIDAGQSQKPQNSWSVLSAASDGEHLRVQRAVNLRGMGSSHNKFLIMDGRLLYFGSANLSTFGLQGAFDSMNRTADHDLRRKFQDEFDELWDESRMFCEGLANDPRLCEQGKETYRYHYYDLLVNSRLANALVQRTDDCRAQVTASVTKALLDNYNQPTALFACLRDEPLRKVLQNIAAREKFVDQQGIQDVCAQEALQESCTKYRYRPRQGEGLTRVYFSPEDNPTAEISRTLHLASLSGPDAFILISASLLTDRYLQKTLMQAKSKGVFLALVLDRFQYERLDAEDREFLQNLGARIFWVDPLFEAYEFVQNHHRFALVWNPHIGKTFVITGSANWSASGLTRNDEHTIISTDPALVESHAQEFLAQLLNFGAKGDENDQDFIGIVLRLRNALGQPIWLEAMAAPKPGRFLLALDKLTFADSFDYEWSLATLDESGTLQRQRFQKLTDERLLLGIDLGPAPLKKIIIERRSLNESHPTLQYELPLDQFRSGAYPALYRFVRLQNPLTH
jgi:phosphatidylserine/phosphatidylglycerophosphate/cardiolipin synthase-like enzyme